MATSAIDADRDALRAGPQIPTRPAGEAFGQPDGPGVLAGAAVGDRVRGRDAASADYLVRPLAIGELTARIKALLRRPGGSLGKTLVAGNISVDTVERDVRVAGVTLALPRREATILEHLMRRLGRVVPRAAMRPAPGAGSRASVVRGRGARAYAKSRARGGFRRHHIDGRATGRFLRLD
mgnify:CR=1 FL=1